MAAYDWTINGKPFSTTDPFVVTRGQGVRWTIVNSTTMWHPMHLHGYTFQINSGGHARTPWRYFPIGPSPVTSTPTTRGNGWCTATTPTTCRPE